MCEVVRLAQSSIISSGALSFFVVYLLGLRFLFLKNSEKERQCWPDGIHATTDGSLLATAHLTSPNKIQAPSTKYTLSDALFYLARL